MAMSLVGYDSADSEIDDASSSKLTNSEKEVPSTAKTSGDLEAEWESFERLISGDASPGQDDCSGKRIPGGVPCPPVSVPGHSRCAEPIFVASAARRSSLEEAPTAYEAHLAHRRIESDAMESSHSNRDFDSDMDMCSSSSEDKELGSAKQSSPNQKSKTCSVSSVKMASVPGVFGNDTGSESDRSDEIFCEKPAQKRLSETDDSDNDEPRKRQRSSSKSDSCGEEEGIADVEHSKTLAGRRLDSVSSASDKSASPKVKSPVRKSENPKSDKTGSSLNKTSEARSSSQDRLRNKLMALAEKKVHRSKSRSRSRDRMASKRHHSPSRHHGRDRDGHRRHSGSSSKGHDRHRRSRSRDGRRRHRHSHSRSPRRHRRSRSHSRHRHHDRHESKPVRKGHELRRGESKSQPPKLTFKEQLRAQMMQVQQQKAEEVSQDVTVIENKSLITANEKKSALPLNNPNPLVAMMSGTKDKVTPQQALMQTMAAVHAKAQEMTGVAVPSYYNPAAVNPIKYAEQLKKRKLLWSKNKEVKETEKEKEVENKAQWTSTSFVADNDGKMAAKFRKLMGIKEEDQLLLSDNVDLSKLTEEQHKRQEELFHQLDREYAFARMTTHTHRGVGLGFQSQGLPDV